MVATGGGNNQEIHLWTLDNGKTMQRLTGVGASIWAVGFLAEGHTLAWGKTSEDISPTDRGPLKYRLTLPASSGGQLGTPQKIEDEPNEAIRAQDEWQNWTLQTPSGQWGANAILEIHHDNSVKARIERGATDGYRHQSYTFTPDGQRIISGGSNGWLTAYDREGNKLGEYVGHTGDVWAVAVSPNGQLLASGSGDQTVRLWNVQSRENLLTLFQGSNGEWVAWTPSGHYTASAQGDKMVGWHINRGVDKAADYVSAAQLRTQLNRPEIVDDTVRLRSVKQALNQAGFKDFSLQQVIGDFLSTD